MNFEYLCYKHQLTDLEQSILKYLYDNIDDLKKIGIRKVAKDNFTSTTSIYKLSKKLGFDGYADLIYNISYSYQSDEKEPYESIHENAYKQINNNLDDFTELLNKSKDKLIMLLGVGLSQIIANYMNERLAMRGFKTLATTHMQFLSEENKNNVLLMVVSHSGETISIKEVVESAKASDIDIISFVGNPNSTIAKLSTLSITLQGFDRLPNSKNTTNTFFPELLLVFESFLSNISE